MPVLLQLLPAPYSSAVARVQLQWGAVPGLGVFKLCLYCHFSPPALLLWLQLGHSFQAVQSCAGTRQLPAVLVLLSRKGGEAGRNGSSVEAVWRCLVLVKLPTPLGMKGWKKQWQWSRCSFQLPDLSVGMEKAADTDVPGKPPSLHQAEARFWPSACSGSFGFLWI